MKHLKQMACLTLAAVFTAGSAVPNTCLFGGGVNEVSASEVTGNKLTIGNPMEGHTYKVYQIFKGDVSTGDPDSIKLSNVEYGKNYTGSGEAEMTAAKEAEALAESVDGLGESKAAKEFAKKVRSQIESDTASEDQKAAFVVLDSGNQYSAGVEPGYYLVVDESNREDVTNDVISDYIVGIIGKDVTVQPKAVTVPDFDKSIDEDAAAETPKKQTTLTITNPEDGYIYKVYQIFTGDVKDGKLVNPGYGANYGGGGDIESDVAALNDATDKKEYAVSIKDAIKGDPAAVLDKNNPSVTVDGGFYVIIVEDEDGNEAADGTVADGESDETVADPDIPVIVLPDDVLDSDVSKADWSYKIDKVEKTITLNSYQGTDISITVYGKYKIEGDSTEYKTILKSNAASYLVDYMFARNKTVQSIVFNEDVDTSTCTGMANMFYGCQNLKNLDISSFDTRNVTNMTNMFRDCKNLSSIKIGNAWTMSNVTGKENIFLNSGLTPSEKQKLDPSYVEGSVVTPLSLFSHSFASESGITTPDAIEIKGDDKTVDYAVGDHVPFKLEATMPESISAYEKYKLVFHDKITKGMKYDQNSLKVYADGTEVPAGNYTAVFGTDENGKQILTVTIDDVKAEPWNAVAGTKITVKYTAELLKEGADGAFNEASLDYSNDPNGETMGTTGGDGEDHDVVEVITFAMTFNKVNKSGDALPGAEFTLYRKGEDGEYAELETIAGTTAFDFDGLKPGDYKLVESTTPDGYNTMPDLIFSIVKEESEADGEKVISVKLVDANGNALDDWSADAKNRAFVTDIANFSGSELPSTGGMGTYLFYIAGAALVIMIGAVMVARKKEAED